MNLFSVNLMVVDHSGSSRSYFKSLQLFLDFIFMARFWNVGNCEIGTRRWINWNTVCVYVDYQTMKCKMTIMIHGTAKWLPYYLNYTGVTLKLWMVMIIRMLVRFINFMLPVRKYYSWELAGNTKDTFTAWFFGVSCTSVHSIVLC